MSVIINGDTGVTTPGVVNTAGETIATTLAVTGASTLTGNVGIGTASTSYKLEVASGDTTAGLGYAIRIRANATALAGSIQFTDAAVTTQNGAIAVDTSANMKFYTISSERMRIDSSGNLLFNSGYGSAATAYGCRAWVSFDGTGTVAIRASGNVSSITDNGVGNYTVNFTTAMPDTNYCVSTGSGGGSTTNPASIVVTSQIVSSFRMLPYQGSNTGFDQPLCMASVFR